MRERLYTIGQMATLCSVSIQTLRYYDKINLMKPSSVDNETKYRYYSDKDIWDLRIIQDMKEIGLSLEEIKELFLKEDDAYITQLLKRKREDYIDRLISTNMILNRINSRIDNLRLQQKAGDCEPDFTRTIEIKQIPERTVVFTRYMSSASYESLAKRFFELDHILRNAQLQPSSCRMAIYHDFLGDYNPDHCDLEICIQIPYSSGNHYIRQIPGGLYATGIFKGPYYGQCTILVNWIQDKGYQIIGPGLEIYHNSFMNTKIPKNYLTEVQFPINRD